VYDALATAIDQVGHDKTQLFLVKLALLNANALASPKTFDAHVQAALRDL
jgi:sulfur relay (sulfurtransferase) complex TusBCD TusD component (DsrE family)